MTPTIDAVARDYAGKAKIGKLDVDANGSTAMRYNVRGIPNFVVFRNGKLVKQQAGVVGHDVMESWLNSAA